MSPWCRWDEEKQEWSPAINIWLSAASHIFYSLGLGQGMLITYSSYNPSHYPIRMNSLIVAAANSATEMFGGFATFSILGYLAKQKGVSVICVLQHPLHLLLPALRSCRLPKLEIQHLNHEA